MYRVAQEVKQPASYKVETVQVPYAAPMLQHTTGEVNGSLTDSRKGVPETSPEEDWDVLSVFDCDQNTIARIQPRLKRLRSATEAVILSSIPKTTRKRKRCNAGYAKKSRIVKRRRGRRFSRDTTNILEFTHGDLSSCSDILTHMKSIISILNLS